MMVSVLIPTFNRSKFLIRLLKYYEDSSYSFKILVGDSSSKKIFEENLALKDNLRIKNNIEFFHTPGKDVIDCLNLVLKNVTTPYAIINPDDDFLIPSTLEKMVKILDKDKSVIGVNGQALILNTSNKRIYPYKMRGITNKQAGQRLLNFSNNYFGVLFTLFRIEHQREIYNVPLEISNDQIKGELYPGFFSVLLGKIYHVNDLLVLRTVGHERKRLTPIELTDKKSFSKLKDSISKKISSTDNVDIKLSNDIFDRSWKSYRYPKFSILNNYIQYWKTMPLKIVYRIIKKNIYELSFHPWNKYINKILSLY